MSPGASGSKCGERYAVGWHGRGRATRKAPHGATGRPGDQGWHTRRECDSTPVCHHSGQHTSLSFRPTASDSSQLPGLTPRCPRGKPCVLSRLLSARVDCQSSPFIASSCHRGKKSTSVKKCVERGDGLESGHRYEPTISFTWIQVGNHGGVHTYVCIHRLACTHMLHGSVSQKRRQPSSDEHIRHGHLSL